MKIWHWMVLIGLILVGGCATDEKAGKAFKMDLPGPTLAARVSGGYELKNRHVRVVIDDKTGDVIYWGSISGNDNLLTNGLQFDISGERSISDGYVEVPDDQTWQYLGEDAAHHLGWRKIYCLDGDHLNVSVLVQNKRTDAVDVVIGLDGFAGSSQWKDEEHFDGSNATGEIHLQAYNEFHDQRAQKPQLLLSDPHHLKPAERISWTMQWNCVMNPHETVSRLSDSAAR